MRCFEGFCSCNLRLFVVNTVSFSLFDNLTCEIADAGLIKQGLFEAPLPTVALMALPFPFLLTPYVFWRYDKLDGAGKRYVNRYTSELLYQKVKRHLRYLYNLYLFICNFITVFRPNHPHLKYFTHHVDRTKVAKPE